MKAISLWQPWASLVTIGAKQIETRAWATGYRGLLVIHAARIRSDKEQAWAMENDAIRYAIARHQHADHAEFSQLPFGEFIAVARLVDCARVFTKLDGTIGLVNSCASDELLERYEARLRDTAEDRFGNYADGRYAWLLDDVKPLAESVAGAGHPRLWSLEPHHLTAISAQIPGLTALSPRPEAPCA